MVRKLPLLLAIVLMALVPSAAQAYLPAGFIGVSPQSAANSKDFELMSEAGIDSVRLPLFWSGVENEDPEYAKPDWSGFDREVELAAEADIRVMPFVYSTPKWVAGAPTDLPVRSVWQRRAWSGFVRAAAERYGPYGEFWSEHTSLPFLPIHRWEIWNEENLVTFATPPDPIAYAGLLRLSGQVLHGVDPDAQVIVGGLFGRPLQVPPNIASGAYLSTLYRAQNVKRYFDGVALHPYVADARAMGAQLENLRRIMRVHRDPATPLYVTELGWGSQSGPTRWQRGLGGQANQLSKAFALLSANRLRWHIGGAWWFTWTDEVGGCAFCRSAGLLTEDREAKPAWYRFNAWTGGDPDTVPRARFRNGDEIEAPEVAEEPEPVEATGDPGD